MRIRDMLREDLIFPALSSTAKDEALLRISQRLALHVPALHQRADVIFQALWERENLGSTGVGQGVAIPHAKLAGLDKLIACFARAPQGIAFDAIDGLPVSLLFVLLVPENAAGAHLKALARISRLLKQAMCREELNRANTVDSLYQTLLLQDEQTL